MNWFRNPFKKDNSVIKVTNEGKLYITIEDFFKQPGIIKQIKQLLESDLIKEIDERKRAAPNI